MYLVSLQNVGAKERKGSLGAPIHFLVEYRKRR
jgi:hypothetical protein